MKHSTQKRLASVCQKLFMVITQLKSIEEDSAIKNLKEKINTMWVEVEKEALHYEYTNKQLINAKFALMATVNYKAQLHDNPITVNDFNMDSAGSIFTKQKKKIETEEDFDVLEIYYLCLALGYKAMDLFEDTDKLREIENTYKTLCRLSSEKTGTSIECLSPNPVSKKQAVEQIRDIPFWPVFIALILVGVLSYIYFTLNVNEAAALAESAIRKFIY